MPDNMIKQKIYLETTMFNYYFDTTKENHRFTLDFFEAIRVGEFEAYTSSYTVRELEAAPEPKRTNMLGLIPRYGVFILEDTDEIKKLAASYIGDGIIPPQKRADALHIAAASANNIDMILSYNFKHINRLKTKIWIPVINQREGYKSIIITQPQEVIDVKDEEQF